MILSELKNHSLAEDVTFNITEPSAHDHSLALNTKIVVERRNVVLVTLLYRVNM